MNDPDILLLLLRCVGDSIQDPLRITGDGSQRCLQIVGNVTDQLTLGILCLNLLDRIGRQPLSHTLHGPGQICKLIASLHINNMVQLTILDLFRRLLHLLDLWHNTSIEPGNQNPCCKQQDQKS